MKYRIRNWAKQLPLMLLVSLMAFLQLACTARASSNTLQTQPLYTQETFDAYVETTRRWIENNRIFVTDNRALEVEANSPYEAKPAMSATNSRGILLVHGLNDSPGYFRDITERLTREGFLVRTILLPGHGTRPEDMIDIEYSDWRRIVSHHVKLLKESVDELWLGGFSTGANLVTSYAISDDTIAGLLLFSPGFVSSEGFLFMTPLLSKVRTWAFENKQPSNFLRYESLAMNAAALYYQSMIDVQEQMEEYDFNRPVLITISEHDSVIAPDAIAELFQQRFSHPESRLIWYGSTPDNEDERTIYMKTDLPEQRISNFSHLSVLFSPSNPFYGQNSAYRMFNNGQEKSHQDTQDDELWFSAWGTQIEGKYHARLTWNPYFDHLNSMISKITNSASLRTTATASGSNSP